MDQDGGGDLDHAGIVGCGRVGELAESARRDVSMVSRQVPKLKSPGFVARRGGQRDARVNEAMVTPTGKKMIQALDAAREKIVAELFAGWNEKDAQVLARLLRRFADQAMNWTAKL